MEAHAKSTVILFSLWQHHGFLEFLILTIHKSSRVQIRSASHSWFYIHFRNCMWHKEYSLKAKYPVYNQNFCFQLHFPGNCPDIECMTEIYSPRKGELPNTIFRGITNFKLVSIDKAILGDAIYSRRGQCSSLTMFSLHISIFLW